MSLTSKVIYEGNLRTSAYHQRSGNAIITDAPIDNNGKGEAFSPTDLVATALASCMITIMGIKARNMELNITGTSAEIHKIMASDPRSISEVVIHMKMPKENYSDKDKKVLENAARTCPVALSLCKKMKQEILFHW